MYSVKKIRYHKYKNIKHPTSNSFSIFESNKNNNCLKKQNNEFILPLIIKNKKIYESYNEVKKDDNNLISTCGMINRKRLYSHRKNKITINSLLNILDNKKELMNDEYRSLDDIYNINKKYNNKLYLNLKEKNYSYKFNPKKKFSKIGLLARFFHKYSSVNSNKRVFSGLKKNNKKVELDDNSSNISFDFSKEISLFNNSNNNNNCGTGRIFLTKLKTNNDNIDISKIINRHNYLIWSIKKNNHKIIDTDRKISINFLLSKVQSELNRDKILYKNNGKTIYELDKELSYKRFKNFENIVNKLFVKKI